MNPVNPCRFATTVAVSCLFVAATAAAASSEYRAGETPYLEREDVQEFIAERAEAGFDREWLEELFEEARPRQDIIDSISSPAEALPWKDYRPIFVNERRVRRGREFMEEQAEWLERAEERFGVEPEMITAIIGIETDYGRNTGSTRVLDALVTLGFDYPPRAAFFRSELGHLLELAEEEDLEILDLHGSYAGAMGYGQFISSSYRHYAVDFDDSGRRDLLNSWPDAIGSVANYFAEHDWRWGQPVVARAEVDDHPEELVEQGYTARFDLDELAEHGVRPAEGETVDPDGDYSLVYLEADEGDVYYLGYPNFYVITRYNRSPLYAMAAHELAQALYD